MEQTSTGGGHMYDGRAVRIYWGRISPGLGQKIFKHRSADGLGDDWPISYDEIKPYYDRVDKMLGVFGTNEGLPNDPDGFF